MDSLISNDEIIVGKKGAFDIYTHGDLHDCATGEPSQGSTPTVLEYFKEKDAVISNAREIIDFLRIHSNETLNRLRVGLGSIIKCIEKYREDPSLLDPHVVAIVQPFFVDILLPHMESDDATSWDMTLSLICSFVYSMSTICGYKSLVQADVFPHQVSLLGRVASMVDVVWDHWESRFVLTLWLSVLVQSPFKFETLGVPSVQSDLYRIGVSGFSLVTSNKSLNKACSAMLARLFNRTDSRDLFDAFLAEPLPPENLLEVVHKTLQLLPRDGMSSATRDKILDCLISAEPAMKTSVRGRRLFVSILADLSVLCDPRSESEFIELRIDQIFDFYGDKDGNVRYSVAKALGRITRSLPPCYARQVIEYLHALRWTTDYEYHTICMCLGEICRRNTMLFSSNQIRDLLVPIVSRAVDALEKERDSLSMSQQIRDSGCAVVWSLSRVIPKELFADCLIVPSVPSLINTSLFERDINLRRAAAAALQELVGRAGSLVFPEGLSIVNIIDFWSVADMDACYLKLPIELLESLNQSKWSRTLCKSMLSHLMTEKLFFNSKRYQVWAAETIALLMVREGNIDAEVSRLCENCISESVEWYERFGALCCVRFLCMHSDRPFSAALQIAIRNIVPTIEKRRLYRGKGGDMIRVACYDLIAATYSAYYRKTIEFKDETKFFEKCLDILTEGVRHLVDHVQLTAIDALEKIVHLSQDSKAEVIERKVIEPALERLSIGRSVNIAERRGLIHTIGRIGIHSDRCLELLIRESASWPTHYLGERDYVDPISRKYAVEGIAKRTEAKGAVDALLAALEDFQTDKRGDVGSWVREAAIDALASLVGNERVLISLIAHSGERLDKVRDRCLGALRLVDHDWLKKISEPYECICSLIELLNEEYVCVLLRPIVSCVGSTTVHSEADKAFRALVERTSEPDQLVWNVLKLVERTAGQRYQSQSDWVHRTLIPVVNVLSLIERAQSGSIRDDSITQLHETVIRASRGSSGLCQIGLLKAVSRLYALFAFKNLTIASFVFSDIVMSGIPKLRQAALADLLVEAMAIDESLAELIESTDWLSENEDDWVAQVRIVGESMGLDFQSLKKQTRSKHQAIVSTDGYCDFIKENYRYS